MNQSTNYNFNLPEGTDLVNLLTQLIPNWSALDTILKGVQDATFQNATETVSLGVHAITRLTPQAKLLKWVATGNFEAGETFTIDGISTPAALPSGEALGDDAYITGAVVIAALNSDESALTVYVTSGTQAVAADSERLGGELPAYYSTKSYADSIKTTADNAATAISLKSLVNTYYDELENKLYKVNADGTKGVDIPMGSKMLDFASSVDLTPSTRIPFNYTPAKDGVLIFGARIISGDTRLYADGKPILHIPSNNDLDPIFLEGIEAGTHLYTQGSIYEDTTGSRMISYIPYK